MSGASFKIEKYSFDRNTIDRMAGPGNSREDNWPVVYHILNNRTLYIGETTNLKKRMLQHLDSQNKEILNGGIVRVVFDDTFNKSAALDLEAFLIRYFAADDSKYEIINRNDGIGDRDYYEKEKYEKCFEEVWKEFIRLGIAHNPISKINNSELFKFSPFKTLNSNQRKVVSDVLYDLDESFSNGTSTINIIDGDAGTGKTIVIMYLAKMLVDLHNFTGDDGETEEESDFSEVFLRNKVFNKHFKDKRIALVVPQTSLCGRIRKVFERKIDTGSAKIEILSPIQFAERDGVFDVTLVDEGHLLKIGSSYQMQARAKMINKNLFGDNKKDHNELEWIVKKSKNVVIVYSSSQRIKPKNITKDNVQEILEKFDRYRKSYLKTQMRSNGGEEYIDYLNNIFSNDENKRLKVKEYFSKSHFEAELHYDIDKFVNKIKEKQGNDDGGNLSRIVSGFAFEWKTKDNSGIDSYDFSIGNQKFRWNSKSKLNDWLGSKNSKNEVGSIFTIQGDDLNYVGVIIGEDLIYRDGKLCFNKKSYKDTGAMQRNAYQIANNEKLDDSYLLGQVIRTYKILMNRAIHGVYLYVCDDGLRAYLSQYFKVVK